MTRKTSFVVITSLLATLIAVATADALSIDRPTPGLEYPKGFEPKTAAAIDAVLQDKQFHYLNGLTSYWPPQYGTTLAYEGDIQSLQKFIQRLRTVEGITVRLTFCLDLSLESGSALSAGSWWVKYSQTTPKVVTVRINLGAKSLDLSKLQLLLPPATADEKVLPPN